MRSTLKRRSTYAVLAIALVSLGAASAAVAGSPTTARPSRGVIVRTVTFPADDPWQAECFDDGCGIPAIFSIDLHAPDGVARVDVSVTATFDYDVRSREDGLDVQASIFGEDSVTHMAPGKFPLASAGGPTSATLSWATRNLVAAGRPYTFRLSMYARPGGDDHQALVTGTRATIRIEWVARGTG